MPTLGIDAFKAKLSGGGAKQNLFQVTCNFPAWAGGNSNLASFMIKAASMPGSTLTVAEVPFRGRKLKIAGDRTFDDWTITVINDVNMPLRSAFEQWSNGINAHIANSGRSNPSSYMTDMAISQLDRGGNVTKTYTLRGCWPSQIAPIDVSYDSEGIQEFQVTLSYQYWEAISTPTTGQGGQSFSASVGGSVSVGPFTVAADVTVG
jgi:hypothetical protein